MPKIHRPSTNGKDEAKSRTAVGAILARLAKRKSGTDDTAIGRDLPDSPVEIITATAAEAAKVVAEIKYLLRGWIPFGMVTGIVAEPGVGKSAFALWLARSIMTGAKWFDGSHGPEKSAKVLWIGTENDLAITLQRMKDWKIPLDRLILPFEDPLATVNLTDARHLVRIEKLINYYKTPAAFVDSLRGGHDGDENSSRVGSILQALSGIAERTGAAIPVVHHTRKLMVDEEITANSSRGSNAILAMMRSQIGLDRPDHNTKRVRVRVLKENLGLAPVPVGFEVTSKGLQFSDPPSKPAKDTRKQGAIDWLLDVLKGGEWHLTSQVVDAADKFGFSRTALQRAREELGVTLDDGTIRKREDGQYEWRLPGGVIRS